MFSPGDPLPAGATTWLEIDHGAIAANVRQLRARTTAGARLLAVIKADAYGHGAVAVARSVLAAGADAPAVASLAEALELRAAGIDAPLLLLGYLSPRAVPQALAARLTLTLFDVAHAQACEREARKAGRPLRAHVKLDSGLGRMGTLVSQARYFMDGLAGLPALQVSGCYTHFALADEDLDWTRQQLRRFLQAVSDLRCRGARLPCLHSANSAAVLTLPESHLDMVRPGIALYGLSPSADRPLPPGFRPALTWKTRVAQLRTLPAGHSAGYGRAWTADRATSVAVLPVGYAHGFRRLPHERGSVLLRGQVAPVIGRVSMDKLSVDVSRIAGVSVGDEVVLLGRQGDREISAETLGRRFGSINYEVVTGLSARMPRLHVNRSST